jgi:hypothetical protein
MYHTWSIDAPHDNDSLDVDSDSISFWEKLEVLETVENMNKEDELSIILQNFSWTKKGNNGGKNKNKINQIYKRGKRTRGISKWNSNRNTS